MSITSTAPKLVRFLRSQNPKPQISFLHLVTEKPSHNQRFEEDDPSSSSPIVTQIVDILKSNDNGTWKGNEHLSNLLFTNPNSLSSDDFLQISRRLGDLSTARNFVEHLMCNSSNPDVSSISFVFQAAFELASREPDCQDKLLELLNSSKELNVPLTIDSSTLLIRCFGKGKMVDKLMMVYEGLDAQMRNCKVRNVLIHELLKSGRLDDALQVLDEMLQPNSEFPANEFTGEIVFAELLKSEKYSRRVKEEEIVELVTKFGGHSVFPDTIRLTQWITKFCKRGRSEKGWDLLHAVMELDGPVETASCNALLTGLGRSGQYKKMNVLMKTMQEKGILPDVITFGISINHLCKSWRVDEALDLFEKMTEGKVGVTIESDVVIYNTIVNGLCKVGRVEDGLAFMRKMVSERKVSPSTPTYNCLIDGFCKAGELERSIELFDEMKKQGVQPNVVTVNSLVDGMCRHGRVGGALEFYREMKDNGIEGNKVTFTTLIGGFCGVNNMNKAMELLDELREKCTLDAVVYYTLISGLSQAGRMDDVASVLVEMRSAGFRPDIGCYNVMINGLRKKNRLTEAYDLVRDMGDNGINPDSVTYNTLISYYSKHGDLNMAHRLLKRMVKDKIYPTVVTYGALIHACCSAGQIEEAMKIFQEMRSSTRIPPNTVIYNTLISSLCQNNNVNAALSLLDDMKVKDVRPNTNTFNAIFKGLQEKKLLDKALELMDRMVEEACHPDYITLEVLTEWLSGVGKADKLRQFLKGYKVSASTA